MPLSAQHVFLQEIEKKQVPKRAACKAQKSLQPYLHLQKTGDTEKWKNRKSIRKRPWNL